MAIRESLSGIGGNVSDGSSGKENNYWKSNGISVTSYYPVIYQVLARSRYIRGFSKLFFTREGLSGFPTRERSRRDLTATWVLDDNNSFVEKTNGRWPTGNCKQSRSSPSFTRIKQKRTANKFWTYWRIDFVNSFVEVLDSRPEIICESIW